MLLSFLSMLSSRNLIIVQVCGKCVLSFIRFGHMGGREIGMFTHFQSLRKEASDMHFHSTILIHFHVKLNTFPLSSGKKRIDQEPQWKLVKSLIIYWLIYEIIKKYFRLLLLLLLFLNTERYKHIFNFSSVFNSDILLLKPSF